MVLIKNIYKGLRINPVSVFQEKGSFLGQKIRDFQEKVVFFSEKFLSPSLSPSLSLSLPLPLPLSIPLPLPVSLSLSLPVSVPAYLPD